ncbi:hypothetical protein L289_0533 [Acinetobacter gerneri DSM 14967 = CIP 107464 = MTCC 9824]|nr:hypothetical protein L289_0533 [Acinetobacter gerneri DSM 14967 = CIP 107464 = MTCC 9824]
MDLYKEYVLVIDLGWEIIFPSMDYIMFYDLYRIIFSFEWLNK